MPNIINKTNPFKVHFNLREGSCEAMSSNNKENKFSFNLQSMCIQFIHVVLKHRKETKLIYTRYINTIHIQQNRVAHSPRLRAMNFYLLGD